MCADTARTSLAQRHEQLQAATAVLAQRDEQLATLQEQLAAAQAAAADSGSAAEARLQAMTVLTATVEATQQVRGANAAVSGAPLIAPNGALTAMLAACCVACCRCAAAEAGVAAG